MGMKDERFDPSDEGTALGRGLLLAPSCRAGVLSSFLNWSLFIVILSSRRQVQRRNRSKSTAKFGREQAEIAWLPLSVCGESEEKAGTMVQVACNPAIAPSLAAHPLVDLQKVGINKVFAMPVLIASLFNLRGATCSSFLHFPRWGS